MTTIQDCLQEVIDRDQAMSFTVPFALEFIEQRTGSRAPSSLTCRWSPPTCFGIMRGPNGVALRMGASPAPLSTANGAIHLVSGACLAMASCMRMNRGISRRSRTTREVSEASERANSL